jgi:hypothetical protein
VKQGSKERQANNVIEMAVRNENINIAKFFVFDEVQTERAQSCSGIEYEDMLAASHFDTRRVAAVPNRRRARASNASTDPPEPNPHR